MDIYVSYWKAIGDSRVEGRNEVSSSLVDLRSNALASGLLGTKKLCFQYLVRWNPQHSSLPPHPGLYQAAPG
jgi:hypothetical protein